MTNNTENEIKKHLESLSKKFNFSFKKKNRVEINKTGIELNYSNAPTGIIYALIDTINLVYLPASDIAVFRGVATIKGESLTNTKNEFYSFMITASDDGKHKTIVKEMDLKHIPVFDLNNSKVTPIKSIDFEQTKNKIPECIFSYATAVKVNSKDEELRVFKVTKLLEKVFITEMTSVVLYSLSLPLFAVKDVPIEYEEETLIDEKDMVEGESYIIQNHLKASVNLVNGNCEIECKVAIRIDNQLYVSSITIVVNPSGKTIISGSLISKSSIAALGQIRFVRVGDISIDNSNKVSVNSSIPSMYRNAVNGNFNSNVSRINNQERENAVADVLTQTGGFVDFLGKLCHLGVPTSTIECKPKTVQISEMNNLEVFIKPEDTSISYDTKYREFSVELTFCSRSNNHDKNSYMEMKLSVEGSFLTPEYTVIQPWTNVEIDLEEDNQTIVIAEIKSYSSTNNLNIQRRLEFDGMTTERVTNLGATPMCVYDHPLVINEMKSLAVNTYGEEFKQIINENVTTLEEANSESLLLITDPAMINIGLPDELNYLVIRKYNSDIISNVEIIRVVMEIKDGSIKINLEEPYSSEIESLKPNIKVIDLEELNRVMSA